MLQVLECILWILELFGECHLPFLNILKKKYSETNVSILVSTIRKLFEKSQECKSIKKSTLIVVMTENSHRSWYPLTSTSLRQSADHEKLRSNKSSFYYAEYYTPQADFLLFSNKVIHSIFAGNLCICLYFYFFLNPLILYSISHRNLQV